MVNQQLRLAEGLAQRHSLAELAAMLGFFGQAAGGLGTGILVILQVLQLNVFGIWPMSRLMYVCVCTWV